MQKFLVERQKLSRILKDQLLLAQQRMKQFADSKRTEREFQAGDWVFMKLQPYRQLFMGAKKNIKLSLKFYGPFLILEKVGTVAYKLQLLRDARIHNVFHVSLLKKKMGSDQLVQQTLPDFSKEFYEVMPLAVLDKRSIRGVNQCNVF